MSTFVAFRMKLRDDWRSWVEPPKAPSNYKKQEAIDSYIGKRWLEYEQSAHQLPLGGKIEAVGILNANTFSIESVSDFLDLARSMSLKTGGAICGTVYGFDIRDRMLQVMVDRFRAEEDFPHRLLSHGFNGEPTIKDPVPTGVPRDALIAIITNEPTAVNIDNLQRLGTDEALEKECRYVHALALRLEYINE